MAAKKKPVSALDTLKAMKKSVPVKPKVKTKAKTAPKTKAPAEKTKSRARPRTPAADPNVLSQVEIDMVNAYFTNGGNQSEAYRSANPKAKNWKPETVHQEASRLFALTKVRTRIAVMRAEQEKRTQITADKVLQEAFRIGFSDIRMLFNDDGTLKNPAEWPEAIVPAVASVEVVESTATNDEGESGSAREFTKKVRLWDKNNALEKLFKHFGLYEADNAQKNPFLTDIENLPLEVVRLIQEKLREAAELPNDGGSGGIDDFGNRYGPRNTQHH